MKSERDLSPVVFLIPREKCMSMTKLDDKDRMILRSEIARLMVAMHREGRVSLDQEPRVVFGYNDKQNLVVVNGNFAQEFVNIPEVFSKS